MDSEKIIDIDFTEEEEEFVSERVINGEPLFFTTSQVANLVGVEPSTVRFWTKRFDPLLDIEVSNKHKRYKKSDIAKLKFIKKLAYEDGLTHQQIEDYCSSKGFNINDIEKGILDANNPIAIQAFVSAATVEMDKKLNNFSEALLNKINESLNIHLSVQQNINDKLQENIIMTIDEVVSEKLDNKLDEIKVYLDEKEMRDRQHLMEIDDKMRIALEENKKQSVEKENNKGWFGRLLGR